MAFDGHRDMLHDRERNAAYQDAIQRSIATLKSQGNAEVTAVDIGSGSSLLACMAVEAGASSVTAFEVNPALARLARAASWQTA